MTPKEYQKAWLKTEKGQAYLQRKRHSASYKAKRKRWYDKHRKCIATGVERENPQAYARRYCANKRRTDPAYRIKYLKRSALKRSLVWELADGEAILLVTSACVYCGDSAEVNGIDRVDNDRGYLPNNCVSCCMLCNRMKHANSVETFVEQCRRVTFFRK